MVLINGVWCQKIYKIGFKLPQKLTDIILNFNGWQLITPGALSVINQDKNFLYCHACQMDSEFDLWVENTISLFRTFNVHFFGLSSSFYDF